MNLKRLLGQNAFWMVNKSLALKVGVEAALLLSLLIDLDNGEWFECSHDLVTEKTGMKRRKVTSAFDALQDAGFIEKDHKGMPRTNHYRICTDLLVQNVQTSMYETYEQVGTKRTNKLVQNVQTCTYKTYEQVGTKRTDIPYNKKESKKETKKRGREIGEEEKVLLSWLDENGLGDIWAEWEQHRKEIRKKLTPTTTLKQLKQLKKIGTARARAALEHSIQQGYSGIYEPRTTKDGSQDKNNVTLTDIQSIVNKRT